MTSTAAPAAVNGEAKRAKSSLPVDRQVCSLLQDLSFEVQHHRSHVNLLQDFLAVFDTLRNELVDDPLIAGQPDFSRTWMHKVCSANNENFNRPECSLEPVRLLKHNG